MEDCFTILGTTIDETDGRARLNIEGQLTVPDDCDDPITELFRPISEKHRKEVSFIITVSRRSDGMMVCTFTPSNRRNRPTKEFLDIVIRNLKGEKGILNEYKNVLELFFTKENGLNAYLRNLELGDFQKTNDGIKEFAKSIGMEIPSWKKKAPKTKAQKKADGIAYLEAHPEVLNK